VSQDEVQQAIEDTRGRRKAVRQAALGKAREDSISEPEPTALERAQQQPEQPQPGGVIPQVDAAEQQQQPEREGSPPA
jgi:hypothetical protein